MGAPYIYEISRLRVKGFTYRVELVIILTKIMNYDAASYAIFSSHVNVLPQGFKYSWHRLVKFFSYRPRFTPQVRRDAKSEMEG